MLAKSCQVIYFGDVTTRGYTVSTQLNQGFGEWGLIQWWSMTLLKKPIHRVTTTALDGSFGPDRDRPIVVTLVPGNGAGTPDTLELRPHGTRRPERIALIDVYRFAIRARVNRKGLEKARLRKERLGAQRERGRIARADAKLRREARAAQFPR